MLFVETELKGAQIIELERREDQRGMLGPTLPAGSQFQALANDLYPLESVLDGPGIVDYVVGAAPAPGVFMRGTHAHPTMQHYLNLYKLGQGALYLFYTPYHLCHFERPNSVARVALFGDATLRPADAPCVDVVATAKIDLKAHTRIDGIGGYHTYGLAENSPLAHAAALLPIGLAEGCVLRHAVPKDAVLTFENPPQAVGL